VSAVVDIRRQFSLDYLKGEAPNAPAQGARELDRAIVLYAQPILDELRGAANQEMHVHDLVRALQGRNIDVGNFEEFLGVINRLAGMGFIKIAQKDTLGNHLVQLTPA